MEPIKFNREIAHLALLQRIELADPFLKKIRKRLEDTCFQMYSLNFL